MLRADIDWSKLPANTPAPIRRLLERCLERDRKRRLQAVGEARIIIEDYRASSSQSFNRAVAAAAAVPSPAPGPRRAVLPWAIAAVATLCLAAVLGWTFLRRAAPQDTIALRADMRLSDTPLTTDLGSGLELSPDASRIVYVAGTTEIQQLYVRESNQLDATKLVDATSNATSPYHPFFSPDGQWVGYVTSSEMRKVPVSGGTPLTLCKLARSRGASWGSDGMIVFAPNPASGLFRVPASGGEPQPLTTLDKSKRESTHRWPQVLPDARAVIFTSHTQAAGDFDNASIEVLTLKTGQRKTLLRGGSYARYVPSGHLVYVSKSTVFAVPFDLAKLEVTGSPAPVVQNVFWNPTEGAAQMSFSSTGMLTYLRGGPEVAKVQHRLGRPEGRHEQAARRARCVRESQALARRQAARAHGAEGQQLRHLGVRPRAWRADPPDVRRCIGHRTDLVAGWQIPRVQLGAEQGGQRLPEARRRIGGGRAPFHGRGSALGQQLGARRPIADRLAP